MAPLDHQPLTTHRPGPSRRSLTLALASAAAILFTGAWFIVQQYHERPPWAEDISYEAGYLEGNRVRKYDRTGVEVAKLLNGGCKTFQSSGWGGIKATYDPSLWVKGCLDGAAGRHPVRQGVLR